eukprot:SAG22_NODE_39_length_26283_cov_18.486653_15_plen_489_part_00
MPPPQALDLLDSSFADTTVRAFAVERLWEMTDEELAIYALQLVQVLKYEQHHDSPVAGFLVARSLRCPNVIGHIVFWHLKAEMHVPEIAERYGLLLELYLEHCGGHREELMLQNQVMTGLIGIADAIKDTRLKKRGDQGDMKLASLRKGLGEMVFPPRFSLPLNPCWVCKGLKVEKCKYMDSKKLPLWLVFENAEPGGKDIYVIFKAGDDLRQDLLTLQLFQVMEHVWRPAGLDLKLIPYGCVATGDEIGMIEVVLDSNTTANINFEEAGGGARAAWDATVFTKWLQKANDNDNDMDVAVNNFAASCAGYCVATYALGIGDRHNDNVMLKRNGNLFHIDFGHFLGNYKSKFGIKREKAPFIFTPAFAHVMGGFETDEAKKTAEYKFFEEQACAAYNELRVQAHHFMSLFRLMLSTGIPELQAAKDILYMRKSLRPGRAMTAGDASKHFKELIMESHNCTTTQMNDAVHMHVHQRKDAKADAKQEKKRS